jgi:hypothetical protein
MTQPVEMTVEQLESRIASGAVSPKALVSRDGSAPVEWTHHPDFADLAKRMGLSSGPQQATANSGNRVDSLRKVREKRLSLSGTHSALENQAQDEAAAMSGATFQTRSYDPDQAFQENAKFQKTTGWKEPDQIQVNQQWRGISLTKTYDALRDVPVLEVFGLPWNAPRNSVNIALLNLTSEIDKEAPKEETQLDARIREKILEVLAACHSSYTSPAHNLVAMRIQHRFERVPFVSEILPYYTEQIVGSFGKQSRQTGAQEATTKARSSRPRPSSSGGEKSNKDGKDAAASSGNTKTFAIIGAVLIALAAGYNVVDCGGGGGEGGGSSGIGPDGQPIH